MGAVTISSDFGAYCFSIYLPWNDRTGCHDLCFRMLSFKPASSLSSFTFIKRLFSSSLSAVRVVSSAYLLLLLSRLSSIRLCVTPWTEANQAPPSLGFSKQEHWSGLPFPSPGMKVKVKSISRVWLLATPWTAAYQALLSMGFSRQEYWSGVPLPSPLHIWGYWYFSQQSWFQLVLHPAQCFSWCTLHIS